MDRFLDWLTEALFQLFGYPPIPTTERKPVVIAEPKKPTITLEIVPTILPKKEVRQLIVDTLWLETDMTTIDCESVADAILQKVHIVEVGADAG